MDIIGKKDIEIVPDSLKTFLDRFCKNCGENSKKL